MKKATLLILLLCLLIGCSTKTKNEEDINTQGVETGLNEEDSTTQEEVPIPQGIKPVIFYHDQLYWMSTDKPTTKLPKGFTLSGDKIVGSEEDVNTIPSKEGFTSAHTSVINESNVGADIYTNPDDPNTIVIFNGNYYISFLVEE